MISTNSSIKFLKDSRLRRVDFTTLWKKWHQNKHPKARVSIQSMDLRVYNERFKKFEVGHVNSVIIGSKELHRVVLDNRFTIDCSKDRKFLVQYGHAEHKCEWFSIDNGLDIGYSILINGIGDVRKFVKIKSIKKLGASESFNLEIKGNYKGFVVNNIVIKGI